MSKVQLGIALSRELLRTVLRARAGSFLLAATLALPTVVWAEEEPLLNRFRIDFGEFFVTRASTTAELAAQAGLITAGTRIDFDDDLGVSDSESVGRIDGYYRFTRRSRIDFSYFKVDRSGTAVTPFDIDFGDIFIPAGTPVTSFFDEEVLRVAYGFSFYNVPKVELGLSAGLHISKVGLGIQAPTEADQAEATAPLPVVGVYLRYNLSPRWRLISRSEIFYIEIDDFKGALTDTRFSVEHQTFKNAGFGFGFNRIALSIEADDGEFRGEFDNTLSGFQVYVFATFGKVEY